MKNQFFSLSLIVAAVVSQAGTSQAHPQDRQNRVRISLQVIETDAEGHTRTQKIGRRAKALLAVTPNQRVFLNFAKDPLTAVEPVFEPGAWSIKGKLPQAVVAQLIEESCDWKCQTEYPVVKAKIADLKEKKGLSDYFYAGAFEVSGADMSYVDDSSEFNLNYSLNDGTELVVRVDLRRWWR